VTIVGPYANHVIFVANPQKTLVAIAVSPYAKVKNAHKNAVIVENIPVMVAGGITSVKNIYTIHVVDLAMIVVRDVFPTKF